MAQGNSGNGGNNSDVGTTVDGIDGFTVITTATPFVINSPNCPQNNVSVDFVQFRNEEGGEFDAQFLADNYELGDLVPGTIWIRVQRSGGANAYNPHVQYDVFLDGEETETIATCVRTVDSDGPNPNTINLEDDTFYKVANFSWEYGKLFEIKNFYMIWNTGNASSSDVSCPDGSGNSQCFFEADGFTVNTPLVTQFDFTTDCSLEVDFINETTGGDPELPYTYSWDFNNDNDEDSSLENPSFEFEEAGTYPVTLTVTNDGVSISQTQDVTVYYPITFSSSREDIDCSEGTGGKIEITELSGGFGEYTIEWTSDDENFVFDDPDALIQSNLPVGTYTVTVTDERGCTNSQEYNITQQGQAPVPTVEDDTVCQAEGSLAYDVTALEGFELAYFSTEISDTEITPAPTVDTSVPGVYSVWVSQSNEFGCESARVQVSITVERAPVAGTDGTLTICEGETPSNQQLFNALEGTPDEGGSWTNNGDDTYTYTVSGEEVCADATATVTVTFNPITEISTDPVDATYCIGDSADDLSVSATGTGTLTYQWFSNDSDSNTGGEAIQGADESEYTPATDVAGTFYYYVVVGSDCGEDVASDVSTITVNPATAITESPEDATYCIDDAAIDLSVSATGTGTLTYQWFSNDTDSNTGGEEIEGADESTYTPATDVAGTFYYYVVVGSDCGEDVASGVSTITVNPATAITESPEDATYCIDDPATDLSVSATGTGSLTYQWFSNDTDSNTGGEEIEGADESTYTPATDVAGTFYYYAVVTGDCGDPVASGVATILVDEVDAPISGGDQIECAEEDIQTLTATAEVGDNETLVWYITENGDETTDSPTLSEVGTVTYYAAAVNNTTQCESQERTPVTLTINDCSIAMVKTVVADPSNEDNCLDTDDNLIYTFTVTNTGNVTIDNVSIDEETFSGTGTLSAIAFVSSSEDSPEGTLLEGETATYTATYTITAEDTQAGLISNQAEVTGTVGDYGNVSDLSGETIEDDEVTQIEICQDPSLAIDKRIDVNDKELNGTLSYIITVTNDGNVTLTNILVEDEQLDFEFLIPSIAPGEEVIFDSSEFEELTMTITSQMIEAECFQNTATAVTVTSDQVPPAFIIDEISDTATACFNQNPAIAILKEAVEPADCITEGDEITYRFTVTNEGNVSLSNVEVTDNKVSDAAITGPLSGDSGEDGILGLEETWIYEITYTVTSDDIDNGEVANIATVTGGFGQFNLSEDSNEVIVDVDETTEISTQPEGDIYCIGDEATALAVIASGEGILTYQWFVNDENTKENAEAIDGAEGSTFVPSTTSAGTLYYFVEVTGECGVVSSDIATVTVDSVPTPIAGAPQVECEEDPIQTLTATATVDGDYDIVWYDAPVGGNVVDPTWNQVGTEIFYAEAVNETTGCVSAERAAVSLTINAAPEVPTNPIDVTICEGDEESITATATVPDGFSIVWYTSAEGDETTANPSLSTVGDITYYAAAVNNETGCESLSRTPVTLEIQEAPDAPTNPVDVTICEGDAESITATATVPDGFSIVWYTTADGDQTTANPSLSSVGDVTYYAAAVNDLTGCESLTRTPVELVINEAPDAPTNPVGNVICEGDAEVITASATVPDGFSIVWYTTADGDQTTDNPSLSSVGNVTYYAAAVNEATGCESLTRTPVELVINEAPDAPITGGDEVACFFEEGQTLTATALVDDGLEIVWYNAPVGGEVVNPVLTGLGTATYYAEAVNPETNCSSLSRTAVTLTFNSCEIAIEKTADVSVVESAGQIINYTLVVTNPGSADLTDVEVIDPLTQFTQTIPVLGAGESVNLETSYEVTQADIDAGLITNTATVTGQVDGNELTSEDTELVNAIQNPSISVVKSDNGSEVTEAGEVITYTLTVTNDGNVTLNNVTVEDPLTGLDITIGTLIPNESEVLATDYEVTQEDVDAGFVLNTVFATGDSPTDETPTDEDEVETPITPNPSILITKDADKESVSEAGEIVTYTLTVTNSGNVTLTNVTVMDPLTELEEVIGTLSPGETVELTTEYVVTVEDLNEGGILNVAIAEGEAPDETPVSDEASEEVESLQLPEIQIVKTTDKTEIQGVGDVVIYTLTITNTGNVTLTDVTVLDPLTELEVNIGDLAPGQVEVLETEYSVTAEDMESDGIVNIANVTATTPDETEIGDEDSVTIGIGPREIIANDDDFGTYFVSYGGRLGNILENDLLDGQRPDPDDVDFEFTELDGIIGLLIDDDGELSLVPGVNEAREYTLEYILRETVFPENSDDALVVFRLQNDNVNLNITKEATQDIIFEGDEFEYEIVVSNIGGFDARNVEITDQLPSGVEYISNEVVDNPSNAEVSTTVTGSTITWTIGFFPADATITFRVRVKAGAAGSVTNTVVVGAEEEDTDESDNEDSDVSEIRPFRIPNVITPNNDGDNDTFEVQGLGKFVSNTITIFNRFGDHVLEQDNYNNDWDAPGQVAGTYFYVLVAVDESGREHEFKGWIQVIKD
ncbi:DUF7507 domain-containing protein [Algoriphagus hitonicola]